MVANELIKAISILIKNEHMNDSDTEDEIKFFV